MRNYLVKFFVWNVVYDRLLVAVCPVDFLWYYECAIVVMVGVRQECP